MAHRLKESAAQPASAVSLPHVLCIGFAGHAKVTHSTACRAPIHDFLVQEQAIEGRLLCGLSTIGTEVDLLFAESCVALQIPLRLFLPLPAENLSEEFTKPIWSRAERVIQSALSVEVIGDGQRRDSRYYECCLAVVQQSQLLLALWNGLPEGDSAGMHDIVTFATQLGAPVVWLHSESGDRKTIGPHNVQNAGRDGDLTFFNALPSPGSNPADKPAANAAEAWQAKLDANAILAAPQVRRLAAVPIVCTAIAAFVSGVGPRMHRVEVWLGTGILLALIAALLPIVLRLGKRQALWVRIRTAAEVTRSVVVLWDAPFLYEMVGPDILPELSGMIRSLNFLKSQTQLGVPTDVASFKENYMESRLLDQERYFSKQARLSAAKGRRYRLVSKVCSVTALLSLAWMFGSRLLIKTTNPASSGLWLPLVTAALFQIATIAAALVVVHDCDRRQRRYQEMVNSLVRWKAELGVFHTWALVIQVVNRVERALLIELLEWRSLLQNTKMPRN